MGKDFLKSRGKRAEESEFTMREIVTETSMWKDSAGEKANLKIRHHTSWSLKVW
jgi:hypothetical protein